MRYEADMIDGPTDYLGHFNNSDFLRAGHNDGGDYDSTHYGFVPSRSGRFGHEVEGLRRGRTEPTYSESDLTKGDVDYERSARTREQAFSRTEPGVSGSFPGTRDKAGLSDDDNEAPWQKPSKDFEY